MALHLAGIGKKAQTDQPLKDACGEREERAHQEDIAKIRNSNDGGHQRHPEKARYAEDDQQPPTQTQQNRENEHRYFQYSWPNGRAWREVSLRTT